MSLLSWVWNSEGQQSVQESEVSIVELLEKHACDWYLNLNSIPYSLNDPIEDTGSLDFKWSPLQKAFVYDTGCNRSVPRKA